MLTKLRDWIQRHDGLPGNLGLVGLVVLAIAALTGSPTGIAAGAALLAAAIVMAVTCALAAPTVDEPTEETQGR